MIVTVKINFPQMSSYLTNESVTWHLICEYVSNSNGNETMIVSTLHKSIPDDTFQIDLTIDTYRWYFPLISVRLNEMQLKGAKSSPERRELRENVVDCCCLMIGCAYYAYNEGREEEKNAGTCM